MTDPCKDIQGYLNGNFGLTQDPSGDGNLFAHKMPPSPDFAVCVQKYEGAAPTETFGNELAVRHPRIQIKVRDTVDIVALDKAEEIMKFLTRVKDQVINGTRYQRIRTVGEPFKIGPDSSEREQVTVNFEASFYDS